MLKAEPKGDQRHFVAGEIVTVLNGPLKDCKVRLLESSSNTLLLVDAHTPEWYVTGDHVLYAIRKDNGHPYGVFNNSVITPLVPNVAKLDHLKEAFFEEDKAVVNLLKKMKKEGLLFSISEVLGVMGYKDKVDRDRISKEFLS